jgi:hypothetical protein
MITSHKTLVLKSIIEIFLYHAQGDYFKPYKAFFNLQNKCSFLGSTKPSWWCMNICSCNSPCKNAILTSKWLMLQLHCDASAHTNLLCSTLPLWQMSPSIVGCSHNQTSQKDVGRLKKLHFLLHLSMWCHLNVMTIMGSSAYFQIWMMRNLNQIVKFFNFMFCLVFRTFEVEVLQSQVRSQL